MVGYGTRVIGGRVRKNDGTKCVCVGGGGRERGYPK